MKIVHLCRLYAPHPGGVETHVSEVNRLLVEQGHEVIVLTEQFERSLPEEEIIQGVRVVRIPHSSMTNKIRVWQWFWAHRDLLGEADVIQVHDVFWWILPLLPGVEENVFTTFHGWETEYPVRWQAKLQRWVYAHLSRATLHIGAWIQEFYWDTPTLISYGGVRSRSLKLKPLNGHELNIAFLGRLSKDNDVQKYCQVVEKLREEKLKVSMTWIGDGELKKDCQKVGKVLGFVEDTSSHLNDADIIFASSYLSILEAQERGKVVVSLYSNTLKQRYLETFPGSHLMLIDDSVSSMVQKIKDIQDKKEFSQIGQQAHRFARSQTWDKVLHFYQTLWLVTV